MVSPLTPDKIFISCDWGNSHLRVRFVGKDNLEILSESQTDFGIGYCYALWNRSAERDRISFYQSILRSEIEKVSKNSQIDVHTAQVVISGMASSSIGMKELPYCQVPTSIDGRMMIIEKMLPSDDFPFHSILVSGIRTANDVMRGEETQLIGSLSVANASNKTLYILPGTHSKHIEAVEGMITGFMTYMTGEFFHLLSSSGILAASVEKPLDTDPMLSAFYSGLSCGSNGNFLNAVFTVRTNVLLDKLDKTANYYYMSGVLIGHELQSLANGSYDRIVLIGSDYLLKLYQLALKRLFPGDVICEKGDENLVRGQWALLQVL